MNPQTSCQEHFGYSDLCTDVDCDGHGTCVSHDSYASCDCETGYAPDGPACLAAP
jgi:hypothetical protein